MKIKPIHPGEYIKDELEELNLSQKQLALALRIPARRISEIVNAKRGITADTAYRLAKYFGTTVELWTNLQFSYDMLMAIEKFKVTGELEKIHPRTE